VAVGQIARDRMMVWAAEIVEADCDVAQAGLR
jgi:hypothetical protein